MSAEKRLSFLRTQFSKIADNIFDQIVSFDPTPEKKYSTWLLRLFSKSKLDLSDLPVLSETITMHLHLKDSIPVEFRDINKFDSSVSFLHSMNVWLVNRFAENENNMRYLKNGAELMFENDNIFIVKLLSFEGSVSYGSGTKWCTLKNDTFYEYASKGTLYVVVPKNDVFTKSFGKKSQLYFEKLEFRNHLNDEINLIEIICQHPELYTPLKKIENSVGNKKSDIYRFLNIENCNSNDIQKLISGYGFKTLNFVTTFSREFMELLFTEFKEKVYGHIPDSTEKTIVYVSTIESGLKTLIQTAEVDISKEVFKEAVMSFPENILLVDYEDENLWELAVSEQAWLIKRSPFINNANKLYDLVLQNITILKYVASATIFNSEQKEKIANNIIVATTQGESYYLEFLVRLGELDEKLQISLIKSFPECVKFLIKPSETAVKLSEELIQRIKDKEKKLQETLEKERQKEQRKRTERRQVDIEIDKENYFKKTLDDYYRNKEYRWGDERDSGQYQYEQDRIWKTSIDNSGNEYYVVESRDGTYRTQKRLTDLEIKSNIPKIPKSKPNCNGYDEVYEA